MAINWALARMLLVGQDPSIFPSIQAALNAIPTLKSAPSVTDQVVIFVYPGFYTTSSALVIPRYVSVVGVATGFPVLFQNNTTDLFQPQGYNQFENFAVIQGTGSGTWAFNCGNNTDISVRGVQMYNPGVIGGAYQGFLTASGSSWARLTAQDCLVDSYTNSGYIVQLTNTSSAVRFCDTWFQQCFFDAYKLKTFGGGLNLVNVQDVRVERSTIRGANRWNTSVRCTYQSGITGTPQVEVRHCYCTGGVSLFCDANTHMDVVNCDAQGAAFSGTTNINNSYTGAAYNPLGPI